MDRDRGLGWTRIGILAFVATMGFFVPRPLASSSMQWSDVVLGITAMGAVAAAPGRLWRAAGRADAVSAILLALTAAVSSLQNGFVDAVGGCAAGAEMAAVFILTMAFMGGDGDGQNDRVRLLRVWCLAAALLAALAFLGLALGGAGVDTPLRGQGHELGPRLGRFRACGACVSPNMLASISLVPWLALVSRCGPRLFTPRARALLVAALSAVLVMAMSRTALAAAFGFMLLSVLGGRISRRAGFGVGLVLAGLDLLSVRFQHATPTLGFHPFLGTGLRWSIWGEALKTAAAHPWFGVGPGSPAAFVESYFNGGPTGWSAHDTVLDLAATQGLPAAALFVGCAGLVLCRAWQRAQAAARGGLAASLVALWAAGLGAMLFDALTIDCERFRHFWLLLGLVAG